jgi:isoleucyl-tRNA synthetase
VQQARREAGLDVSDRIDVVIGAPEDVTAAVATHEEFLRGETLAEQVTYSHGTDGLEGYTGTVGDGARLIATVSKV